MLNLVKKLRASMEAARQKRARDGEISAEAYKANSRQDVMIAMGDVLPKGKKGRLYPVGDPHDFGHVPAVRKDNYAHLLARTPEIGVLGLRKVLRAGLYVADINDQSGYRPGEILVRLAANARTGSERKRALETIVVAARGGFVFDTKAIELAGTPDRIEIVRNAVAKGKQREHTVAQRRNMVGRDLDLLKTKNLQKPAHSGSALSTPSV